MGVAQQILAAGGASYSAEATALFARMSSQPDASRKGHIDTLIGALKTAGVWSKLDALYLFAAHDSQAAVLNWLGSTYNATLSGSPTFTTDRGIAVVGAGQIKTNFTPSTASSPRYSQNSAHISYWSRTSTALSAQDVAWDFGVPTNSGPYLLLGARSVSNTAHGYFNNSSSATYASGVTDGSRLFTFNRSSSTSVQTYRNGSSIGSATTSSTDGLPTQNLGFGAFNATARQIAFASIGGGLTSGEAADLYSAVQSYMTAVGA